MSGKQLAVNQSLSPTRNSQNVSSHDDIDVLVDQLLRRNTHSASGTAEEMLCHPQVKKHGILGRLSSSQQSLVTSVVSLMQDRVTSDSQKNADALKQIIIHEREALSHMSRSFAETAKHLYQLPLLGRAGREENVVDHDVMHQRSAHSAGVPQGPPPRGLSLWERFLTWGNLLAGTAVVLAVLVVKTSVETASFETQYRLTQESLEQTRIELEKSQTVQQQFQADNTALAEQNAALSARIEEHAKQQANDQQRLAADMQSQAKLLDDARQTIARQQAQLAQTETSKNTGHANLKDEISVLQQQIATLKGKETQQVENAQMWKQLAEERKQEMDTLQARLLDKESAARKKADKPKGLLGIFQ